MEKIVEQALLYDFYGELLTDHQKEIFEEHVLNDYSISEVAASRGISRQGAHDMIKRCNKILMGYEDKLHLVAKFLRTKRRVEKIHQLAGSIELGDTKPENVALIKQIEKESYAILEEL